MWLGKKDTPMVMAYVFIVEDGARMDSSAVEVLFLSPCTFVNEFCGPIPGHVEEVDFTCTE